MLPWSAVLERDGVYFVGNDAYYHMRRIVYGLAHFPDWLDFDPYLNFPHGAKPIWTPVFDWLATLFALPFASAAGIPAAEAAAAIFPALLGACCVVALYFAARRMFDEPTARIAGGLLAIMTGHSWYSQIGFLDHHAAVALVAAVMLGAALRFVLPTRPTTSSSLALSATQAMALLVWPGMLLHVGLVELGVVVAVLVRDRSGSHVGEDAMRARALGHLFAALLVAPLCLGQSWPQAQWGAWSATVLSHFQPWLFSAMAAHAAICSAALHTSALQSPARRVGFALAIAIAITAASGLLLPGLGNSAAEAWRWLSRQEGFQSHVTESLPLLEQRGHFTLERLLRNLSGFGLLLPVTLTALVWRSRRRADFGARLLLAVFAGGLLVAALLQRRFGNSAALGIAIVSAWAIREIWLAAAALAGSRTGLARGAVTIAVGVALLPTLRPHVPHLRLSLARWHGAEIDYGGYLTSKRRLLDAGRWIAANGGEVGDLSDASHVPPYGVMAPWHLGHRLLYTSHLPTVVGNFGDDLGEPNYALHGEYLHAAEPHAARLLDQVRARFVVVESLSARARRRLRPAMTLRRLTDDPLRGLAYHRLRYATQVPDWRPDLSSYRSYRTFERVAGVAVTGRAPPGALVEARMLVAAGDGRIEVLHQTTASEDGWYRFQLAQASGDSAGGGWQLSAGQRSAPLPVPLEVSEAEVVRGAELTGPDLR